MENSNPSQPASMQPSVQVPGDSSGNNKMVLWLITGLIITILIAGAVYWYLNNQQTSSNQQISKEPTPILESAKLDSELNSIDIPEMDENFSEVDKDINSL